MKTTNSFLSLPTQQSLMRLEHYRPAHITILPNIYIEDSTVKSETTVVTKAETQKTFGSSFSAGFGDAVSGPFDVTFDLLFQATGSGGPGAMSIGPLLAVPSVAVAVISLPISVPCGIVNGLVQGFATLVGTQIPSP